LKQIVIAIVGGKKVGKTTTTENLILEFTNRGYQVAALKHISEPDFTIDTKGKDTYRFAQHGGRRTSSSLVPVRISMGMT